MRDIRQQALLRRNQAGDAFRHMVKFVSQLRQLVTTFTNFRRHSSIEVALSKFLHGGWQFFQRPGQVQPDQITDYSRYEYADQNSRVGEEWRGGPRRSEPGREKMACRAGRYHEPARSGSTQSRTTRE